MADKAIATTDRERLIADTIRNACLPITDDTDAVFAHKDAIQALNEGLSNTRLAIMAQVAQLSDADKWLPGEIKNATAYAAANPGNSDPKHRTSKSLATFMSEMNVVAHPKVRNRFPTLLSAVETVWAQEDQAKIDDGPMPVRKWASRKMHALMNVMRAVKDGKADINSAEDLIEYATENDPDFNAERVAKRLETIAKALHGVFVDFNNDDIGRAAAYIEAITAEQLIASRNKKIADERKAAKEHRNLKPGDAVRETAAAARKITPVVTPVATAQEPTQHTPIEGAFDPLDDVLNDRDDDAVDETALIHSEIERLAA